MNVPRASFLAATVFCGVFSVSAGDESGDPFSRYVAENAGFHAYSRVGNGYISTSGNISDSEPVAIECISGEVKIGDCGEIGGYV